MKNSMLPQMHQTESAGAGVNGDVNSGADIIDIGQIISAILRFKWSILGLACVIALATALVMFTKQPMYQARASLIMETPSSKPVDVGGSNLSYYYNWEYYETQYEILRSRNMAERVVLKLGLHKPPYVQPAGTETTSKKDTSWFNLKALLPAEKKQPPKQLTEDEKTAQRIASKTSFVAGGLTVEPAESSQLVYLSFRSGDPKLAALIVNTVVAEFISQHLESRLERTQVATVWLSERLAGLRENLRESEQRLQNFRDQEQLVDLSGVATLSAQELNELNARRTGARRARMDAESLKSEVESLGPNSTVEQLLSLPSVLSQPSVTKANSTYLRVGRNLAALTKRYGPKHPKMVAANLEMDAATQGLKRTVQAVVSDLSRQYKLARRSELEIEALLGSSKAELQDINRKEFKLNEYQREIDTNRQLYEAFFTQIKQTGETGSFEAAHARLLDPALVPSSPLALNEKLTVLAAFVLGIVLGSGAAVLLAILDNTVKVPEEVEGLLGVPSLGAIPMMEADKDGNFEFYWNNAQGAYAEAIRTVRTGVVLSSLDKPAKIIVVTSSIPGEGKSTLSLNLGASLAQMEKTLVIGADMRRPTLAKKCGLAPNQKGLSSFVSGAADLDDCIAYMEESGMYVMPAGVIPPNPLELLSSRKFVDALDVLRQRFDRVVIDSAPTQAVSDALMLASYADSVIYVVKADKTPATLAKKGIASMQASNQPITGVVLNEFNVKKAGSYYGSKYYKYHYNDYYQSAES
ncbi:MAG: polysaccharide biosynthesis tyrosine autokinase [Pseudomonadales bacterium]